MTRSSGISNSIVSALAIIICQNVDAFEVTHQVRPNSEHGTTALNRACSTVEGAHFSTKCNPALFPYSQESGVEFSLIGKSDGDSIDNGKALIFSPITEELIQKLFRERNYNSFTFTGDITLKTKYFNLSYEPYYLLADIYIFNPAFPEISMHLVNQESLRLTSGIELIKKSTGKTTFNMSMGASAYYYEHLYENTVFSLFDLSYKKPNELIHFKKVRGVAGDMGAFLNNDSRFFPKLSCQVKNVRSRLQEEKEFSKSDVRQSTIFLFDTYSTIGVGKGIKTTVGGIDLDYEIPFLGIYRDMYPDHSILGGRYTLGLFSLFIGYGKYYQNAGLQFSSTNFNVGLNYTRESDMGAKQAKPERAVYTSIDVML